jgi:hypothetical protein
MSISKCKLHNNKCSTSATMYSFFHYIFIAGLSYWNCEVVIYSKGRQFAQNFTKMQLASFRLKAADRRTDRPLFSCITVLGANNTQRGNMLTTWEMFEINRCYYCSLSPNLSSYRTIIYKGFTSVPFVFLFVLIPNWFASAHRSFWIFVIWMCSNSDV